MVIDRRFMAIALALSLAASRAPAHPGVLGIVTQAKDANLSTGPVSAGTTVYDGDRLWTQAEGALTFRSGTAMLYLARESRMTLRSLPDKAKGTKADLDAGTLVFSATQAATLEIFADEARIRAGADTPTVGQITVIGPKTLYIYARQGSLAFSYQDESEVIPEGKSYRVVLDPLDDDSAAKPGEDHSGGQTRRRRKGFIFLLIGAGTAVSSILRKLNEVESPDHP